MIITTDLIKSLNPCKSGLDNFLTQYGHYWQGTHREFAALGNVSYSDKMWVLCRLYPNLKRKIFSTLCYSGVDSELKQLIELIDELEKHQATLAKNLANLSLDKLDEQEAIKTKDTPMFQVGDIVEWCGIRGVVESTSDMLSSVQCMFGYKDNTHRKQTFTSDGKLCTWHIVPSLKLIERPKKKIKMYKVLFKRLEYKNQFQVSGDHYADREDFESRTYGNQFIQLIKESEIEVEE